jgi:uncharacterized protein (TIGR02391 family)
MDVIGLKDTSSQSTTWKRVYDSLLNHQRKTKSGDIVAAFIEECMRPSRYRTQPHIFIRFRSDLNETLAFESLSIDDTGHLLQGVEARTLEEAAERADWVIAELRRRNVHLEIMKYCDRELLQKNLYHGFHEATKSLFGRLRQATIEVKDGGELIDLLFSTNKSALVVAINECETESDIAEQKGIGNLLRGAYGAWRNPTAHGLRATYDLQEQDVLDALTTVSFLHCRLDSAINTNTGEPVP